MEFQAFRGELQRMADITRGLAAIGAALRLRQAKTKAHPDVEGRLSEVIEALIPDAFAGLDEAQVATASTLITHAFEEARDLLERPDRAPAWEVRDPAMLQAQGQASRAVLHRIIALAADRPALKAALAGRFLDVGAGVGAIALEAAAQCPSLHVVGLDIWEPALMLARANVAASPHAARIEIRAQDVTSLDEVAAYTLAWLPAPFLTQPVAQAALDRLVVALGERRNGGPTARPRSELGRDMRRPPRRDICDGPNGPPRALTEKHMRWLRLRASTSLLFERTRRWHQDRPAPAARPHQASPSPAAFTPASP
jgi:SAM-dependent methyltransferase